VVEFKKTQAYDDWLKQLDLQARARIVARVTRFEATGRPGDNAPVGEGVREIKLDFGPGYRVYYIELEATIILLGGDKSTQRKDIKRAKLYAQYWKGQKP
jgi:putative addiction module killer protein